MTKAKHPSAQYQGNPFLGTQIWIGGWVYQVITSTHPEDGGNAVYGVKPLKEDGEVNESQEFKILTSRQLKAHIVANR